VPERPGCEALHDDPAPVWLVVATEWFSRNGGLSTFNRALCADLAALGQRVLCLVPNSTHEEELDASQHGVTLVQAPPELGAGDEARLRRRPDLHGEVPAVIVGHGRVTGPAARALRDEFFGDARRVHVVHTAPGQIEWFKADPTEGSRAAILEEREKIERDLATTADVVAAVGPLLTRETASLSGASVIELLPGLAPGLLGEPRTPPDTFRVLLAGRAEDMTLKGLDIAAEAIGKFGVPDLSRDRVQLIVRGAPRGEGSELRRRLGGTAGNELLVQVYEYSDDVADLRLDFERSSLVLMPSRSEGFGLVALEAIDLGVPALVSSASGLGEILVDLGEPASGCVVAVTGDGNDPVRWFEAMRLALHDRPAAFARALEVRDQFAALDARMGIALLEALQLPRLESRDERSTAGQQQLGGAPVPISICRLPPRNLAFAARTTLLEQLDSEFPPPEERRFTVVLTGLGGVGKTELALELAHRRKTQYDVVWWVRARSVDDAESDMAALAVALGVCSSETSLDAASEAARSWLAEHRSWLVLFDGPSSPGVAARLVPAGEGGHVVITSQQDGGWLALEWQPRKVDGFSEEEAVAFLCARSGDSDSEAASALAQALGCLPLALAQAAAYTDEHGLGLRDYAERLERQSPGIFSAAEQPVVGDVPRSVATVWAIAHEAIEKEPLASEYLTLLAFMGPTGVPRDVLQQFVQLAGSEATVGDVLVHDRAVATLLRYSQATATSGDLTVHPLVARVVRSRLGEREAGEWGLEAARVLVRSLPEDPAEPENAARYARLRGPASEVLKHLDALPQDQKPGVSADVRDAAAQLRERIDAFDAAQQHITGGTPPPSRDDTSR
jgi:glycosyltransferase involved in cell wall biosynthesis